MVNCRYGPEGKVEAGQVTVPSTWLDDIKAELVEIAHGGKSGEIGYTTLYTR